MCVWVLLCSFVDCVILIFLLDFSLPFIERWILISHCWMMNSWAQCVIRLKKSEKGIGKLNGIDDEDVCGCYMVRLCPHDLFVTAQVDLGTCLRIHDQNLEEMELEAMLASYLIVQI